MTSFSIRRLRIFAVLITWGNYNYGVIYDEVKNTAALRVVGAVATFYTKRTTITPVGFGTRKDIHFKIGSLQCLTGSGAQLARSTTTTVKKAALQQLL